MRIDDARSRAAPAARPPPGPKRRRRVWTHPIVLVPLAFLAGIAVTMAVYGSAGLLERAADVVDAPTPHERYARALREAGLAEHALGQAWLRAADGALVAPLAAPLPYRESGYFPADTASAVAWRLAGRRGQRLRAQLTAESADSVQLFLDLFEADSGETPPWRHRATADSLGRIDYELERDGTYLVRLQPELLRAVRWTLTLEAEPVLAFPVEGRDARAIRSFFGAERDGGRRSHHGVDIFAPRGTPAVAAVEGVVREAGTNRLGGLVVWLRDERRGQTYYYAHLDSQLVEDGQRVRPGDTLGLVGNTGNARTTPPHLHFGIYRRGEGPIDPLAWIAGPEGEAPAALPDSAPLDWTGRAARARTALRTAPIEPDEEEENEPLLELERGAVVQVLGGNADWLRVVAPTGATGYVARRAIEPATRPLDRRTLEAAVALLDRPAPAGLLRDSLPAGSTVEVLGGFGPWLYARSAEGEAGWLPS